MNSWAHPLCAVAFDMDGLMVNTEDLYTEVGEIILSRRGRKFSYELKKAMMGLPGPKAWGVMISHTALSSDTPTTLAAESDEIFIDLLPQKLQAMPGLETLLEHLDELQLPRCIATSSSHAFVDRVLDITGLRARFDFVVTAEDVIHGKPAPDIYIEAARRLNTTPSNMLVLEDSHHGSRAGLASGACTIAVPGEHSHDHDFDGVLFEAKTLADSRIRQLLTTNRPV